MVAVAVRGRGKSATAHDGRGAALMVAGNCLRRLVLCAVLFGPSAQQQRDGGAETMAAIGVQVSVIVRVGNESRCASSEDASAATTLNANGCRTPLPNGHFAPLSTP